MTWILNLYKSKHVNIFFSFFFVGREKNIYIPYRENVCNLTVIFIFIEDHYRFSFLFFIFPIDSYHLCLDTFSCLLLFLFNFCFFPFSYFSINLWKRGYVCILNLWKIFVYLENFMVKINILFLGKLRKNNILCFK